MILALLSFYVKEKGEKMIVEVNVTNKIAALVDKSVVGVCGNSDYVIHFNFDEEWDAYETKTARFKWGGKYTDVVFDGDECPMPIIYNTNTLAIGVYAGELHTTTVAVLYMKKSILCGSGTPVDPEPDVYGQIMEKLNALDGATPATADTLGLIKVGDNLSITEDGTLSADASGGGSGAISDDDILECLIAADMLAAVTSGGAILADENNQIILM